MDLFDFDEIFTNDKLTGILLKVALSTIKPNPNFYVWSLISIETTIHFKYAFNTD